MADPRLKPLVALLVLFTGACEGHSDQGQSSITVKLPPRRQRPAEPEFTFRTVKGRGSH